MNLNLTTLQSVSVRRWQGWMICGCPLTPGCLKLCVSEASYVYLNQYTSGDLFDAYDVSISDMGFYGSKQRD
jgi:hypothetical protein